MTADWRHFVQRSINSSQVVLCLTKDEVGSVVALAIDQQHHPRDRVIDAPKRNALPATANGVANARSELVPISLASLKSGDPYVHAAISSQPARSVAAI